MEHLIRAIDESGVPRKVIASELAVSEPHCSRLLSGQQAFPLSDLDLLPRSIVDAWLCAYATARGLRVERPDERTRAIASALTAMAKAIEAIGLQGAERA